MKDTKTFDAIDRARYKGIGLVSMTKALRSMSDEQKWSRFVEALPVQTRELVVLRQPVVSEWIPLRHSKNVIAAACETLFDGDSTQMFEVGRRSIANGLKLVYRVFIRVLNAEWVMNKTPQIFNSYYQGNGEARCEKIDPGVSLTRFEGVVIPSPAYWQMIRGCCYACTEATQLSDIEVDIVEGGGTTSSALIQTKWRVEDRYSFSRA